jgi:hypothetical protein
MINNSLYKVFVEKSIHLLKIYLINYKSDE